MNNDSLIEKLHAGFVAALHNKPSILMDAYYNHTFDRSAQQLADVAIAIVNQFMEGASAQSADATLDGSEVQRSASCTMELTPSANSLSATSLLKELRDTTPITAQRKRIDGFLATMGDISARKDEIHKANASVRTLSPATMGADAPGGTNSEGRLAISSGAAPTNHASDAPVGESFLNDGELHQFQIAARRDDLFSVIVPSDVRRLVAEIFRLQDQIKQVATKQQDSARRAENGTGAQEIGAAHTEAQRGEISDVALVDLMLEGARLSKDKTSNRRNMHYALKAIAPYLRTSEPDFLYISKGDTGLFYASSPYIPGLLIADPNLEELYRQVPLAVVALHEAKSPEPVSNGLVDVLVGLNKAVDYYWNGVGTAEEEKEVTAWQKKSKTVLQEHGYVP